ncbi:MAG: LPS export ABC transporter periplasmic protein LptC [Deltaproteobacteria bacterium]|nr:LPS export ABC transporter periplasmic protein LptC [Deltaproteobacteria bacterium]
MFNYSDLLRVRQAFLWFGWGYLILLLSVVSYRSLGRQSLLHIDQSAWSAASSADAVDNSRLQLQGLYRAEIKDGRKLWQLRAQDAQHFVAENLTQVNNSDFTIYRKGQGPVEITSKAAKLISDGETLGKVDLEGDVRVKLDADTEIITSLAFYYSGKNKIVSPGQFTLQGKGYQIEGIGVEVDLEPQVINVLKNTRSTFNKGATAYNINSR